jgi:hypothetical protein
VTRAFSGVFMPAAAAVVLVIFFSVFSPRPAGVEGGEILATLTDAELFELRQSGRDTGILESVETNGGGETSLMDFLADLISEEGSVDGLSTLTDPEEVLRQVDDAQFAEIVGLLKSQ